MPFGFKIKAMVGHVRAGEVKTPHGVVKTPIFMPVGTQASVKSLSPEDLKICGAQIILGGNTYHMWLRPGMEVIKKAGGMHQFMHWDGPMLTDSGGFQVFSLAGMSLQGEKGVKFEGHLMTPEKSIEVQKINGADIIMAFDQPLSDDKPKAMVQKAIERTYRWLIRSKEAWLKNKCKSTTTRKYQALFGIIQGGIYRDLRRRSAELTLQEDLPGVALGGETIGYNMGKTAEIIDWLRDLLPEDKPRYCMGLGRDPQDIITAISLGIDIFDCVAPTRLARNGSLYNGFLVKSGMTFKSEFPKGRLNIANSRFKNDQKPIDEYCDCYTCRHGFSRSYLQHLFKCHELLYYRLASLHNVRFMIKLCEDLREQIIL